MLSRTRRNTILAIGLLLLLVVVLISFSTPAEYRICYQDERSGNQHCASHKIEPFIALEILEFLTAYNGAITALATGVIAWFTRTLWLSTKGLAEASTNQMEIADRSAKAAERAATVAERALEQTSAPYLAAIVTLKAPISRFLAGEGGYQLITGDVFAEYVIHNYGQGPAVVLDIFPYSVRFAAQPAPIPFPPGRTTLNKVFTIGGQQESEPFIINYPMEGVDNLKEGASIWVGLQIRYRDIFKSQYISNYCAALNVHSAKFIAYGDQGYNDRRKLTDDEVRMVEAKGG